MACLQWVVQGAVEVNTGANPSAEGAEEDEGVDDQATKVVDIVDTFRLQVCFNWLISSLSIKIFRLPLPMQFIKQHSHWLTSLIGHPMNTTGRSSVFYLRL